MWNEEIENWNLDKSLLLKVVRRVQEAQLSLGQENYKYVGLQHSENHLQH